VLHVIALLVLAFNDKTGLERAVLARATNMAEIVSMKDAHRK
jgi:collagenase-like PrtC family protease